MPAREHVSMTRRSDISVTTRIMTSVYRRGNIQTDASHAWGSLVNFRPLVRTVVFNNAPEPPLQPAPQPAPEPPPQLLRNAQAPPKPAPEPPASETPELASEPPPEADDELPEPTGCRGC